MRSRDGFTIFELVAVILIIGIVMATALPRMASMLKRSPLEGAATALSMDLRNAQAMAGRTRQPIRVSTDTVNKVVRLRNFATPTLVHHERFLNEDSEFPLSRLTTTDTMILVYPNGTTDGAATFTLGVADQQRTVQITRAGQVRVAQ